MQARYFLDAGRIQEKTGKALVILNLSIQESGTEIPSFCALSVFVPLRAMLKCSPQCGRVSSLGTDQCPWKGCRHPVLATLPPWRAELKGVFLETERSPYQMLTLLPSLPWRFQPLELKEWMYHWSITHCKTRVVAAGRGMRHRRLQEPDTDNTIPAKVCKPQVSSWWPDWNNPQHSLLNSRISIGTFAFTSSFFQETGFLYKKKKVFSCLFWNVKRLHWVHIPVNWDSKYHFL